MGAVPTVRRPTQGLSLQDPVFRHLAAGQRACGAAGVSFPRRLHCTVPARARELVRERDVSQALAHDQAATDVGCAQVMSGTRLVIVVPASPRKMAARSFSAPMA